jgi:hypothetical protein
MILSTLLIINCIYNNFKCIYDGGKVGPRPSDRMGGALWNSAISL